MLFPDLLGDSERDLLTHPTWHMEQPSLSRSISPELHEHLLCAGCLARLGDDQGPALGSQETVSHAEPSHMPSLEDHNARQKK